MARPYFFIFLSCLSLTLPYVNAYPETFSPDALEINQDWEHAIREVLLSEESTNATLATTPSKEEDTLESKNELSTINTPTEPSIDEALATTEIPSTISTPKASFDPAPVEIIVEEEKENDDDEENAETSPRPASDSVASQSSPESSQSEDSGLTEESADEDDESPGSRSDRLRPILQEAFAELPLRKLHFSANFTESQIWSGWATLTNILSQETSTLARSVLTPVVIEIFYEVPDLGARCSNALMALGTALQENELWALQMLDSNGRFPTGLLSGTTASFGDFDQCLAVKVVDQEAQTITSQGKYCLLEMSLPVPELQAGKRLKMSDTYLMDSLKAILASQADVKMKPDLEENLQKLLYSFYSTKLYNGICIPSVCTESDMEVLYKAFLGSFIQLNVTNCQTEKIIQPKELQSLSNVKLLCKIITEFFQNLDEFQLISIIILSSCLILVILATFIDLIFLSSSSKSSKPTIFAIYIHAFSACANWRKLTSLKPSARKYSWAQPNLQFINGIRVLASFWIVYIHVCIMGTLFVPMIIYRFEAEARPFGSSLLMQFVYNGYASVEVFFFLSGFVLVFVTLRNRSKSSDPEEFDSILKRPNPLFYAGLRALRLLIPMIGLLSLHFLWPLLGSGPVFGKFSQQLLGSCRESYWKNLLLINNYDRTDEVCLVHTWFLSADFQLHLIAYLLVLGYNFNEVIGYFLNVAFIALGIILPSEEIRSRGAPATLSAFIEAIVGHFYDDQKAIYYPVQNHLSCYFLGFLLAYQILKSIEGRSNSLELPELSANSNKILLSKPKNQRNKTTCLLTLGTFGFFTMAIVAIFSAYAWSFEDGPLISNQTIGMFYYGLHRVIFILAPAWTVFLCIKWPKNPISRFLSSGFFQILARLSFSIYLVHILVVWFFYLSTRTYVRLQLPETILMTGGVLLYTLPLSLAFHLIFEAPWANLLKNILKPKKKEHEERETSHTDSYGQQGTERPESEIHLEEEKNGNYVTKLTMK